MTKNTSFLSADGFIKMPATEAAIAIVAPTDRSTPAVAITRVMPMASSITVEPLRKMSIKLPCRLPSRFSMAKKPGEGKYKGYDVQGEGQYDPALSNERIGLVGDLDPQSVGDQLGNATP